MTRTSDRDDGLQLSKSDSGPIEMRDRAWLLILFLNL